MVALFLLAAAVVPLDFDPPACFTLRADPALPEAPEPFASAPFELAPVRPCSFASTNLQKRLVRPPFVFS